MNPLIQCSQGSEEEVDVNAQLGLEVVHADLLDQSGQLLEDGGRLGEVSRLIALKQLRSDQVQLPDFIKFSLEYKKLYSKHKLLMNFRSIMSMKRKKVIEEWMNAIR